MSERVCSRCGATEWYDRGHCKPCTKARAKLWYKANTERARICGEVIPEGSSWHLDHIVPIARGGGHTWENVAVSHATCNIRKGAKLLSPVTAHA
jgi:5-methylcytosine-specific restriction endonuclease McrA